MLKARPAELRDAAAIAEIYNQGIDERIATFETEHRTTSSVEGLLGARAARYPAVAVEDDALAATLSVTLDGATTQLSWPAGARMLDVLIDAGLDAPYSCRQGICGACACQLTSGKVEMAHNEVLAEDDLAEGYILACQALAQTSGVSITY